ncbi:acylphosphatase [Sphingobium lactosutens]|uniref:acylphosphatase n=1 Tax=Sphingobium lactosutens DS20 TaxID=1331060 RepID=T0HU36_9SPHN|nr:acylphosphatase [Sphingobium lactosutens]EQB15663.1 hypothetical protein RLDS_10325 [Sphingobium lactosutens DS20]
MTRVARRLTITGQVQGVWYRAWAVETAQGLGLTGWVRNRSDGNVEAVVEGDEAVIERFISLAHIGSPAAQVDRIAIDDVADGGHQDFTKRPTV